MKRTSTRAISSLSVVIIATNCADSIEKRLKQAKKSASQFTENVQFLVVNNGSTDSMDSVLASLKKKNKKLEIITLRKTMRIGDAFLSSIVKVKNDWIFYTLGDDQYDIAELENFLSAATNSLDVVNGLRTIPKKNVKTLGASIRNKLIKNVFILPVKDIHSDFKLIRTSVYRSCLFRHFENDFHRELLVKLKARKARFKEVPVTFQPSDTPLVDMDDLKDSLGAFRSKLRFIESVKLS